jgi:hypothetical protein
MKTSAAMLFILRASLATFGPRVTIHAAPLTQSKSAAADRLQTLSTLVALLYSILSVLTYTELARSERGSGSPTAQGVSIVTDHRCSSTYSLRTTQYCDSMSEQRADDLP